VDVAVADLLTVGGASAVVTLCMSVLLGALAWPPATVDRFGPLLAVGVGLVLVTAAALVVGASVPQAVLTGLLAGCASQGIQQVVKAVGTTTAPGGEGR
jgi:hypothetical protein